MGASTGACEHVDLLRRRMSGTWRGIGCMGEEEVCPSVIKVGEFTNEDIRSQLQ